ncbi:hypothetical protein VTN00DRAFT_317 [Thermoascus crustaceus]|uniref:uncharacterized protein n=1 Tax=Thermoascus crustaceus TaxID=5088 RepID=UPI003743F6E0
MSTLHDKAGIMMKFDEFLAAIGHEVEDVEEESFLLFSQEIPSRNLGFVDSRASTLDVSIGEQDFTIHQSPTLLSSSRAGGTTGAVLWKITPLFAEWISSKTTTKNSNPNPFWTSSILTPASTVVELGCGISGLVALALAPSVGHYIATDQEYVHKLLRKNLDENAEVAYHHSRHGGRQGKKQQQRGVKPSPRGRHGRNDHGQGHGDGHDDGDRPYNITFTALDWELDAPASLKQTVSEVKARNKAKARHHHHEADRKSPESEDDEEDVGFDLLISCDCIYNEALVGSFVRTCADICRLRPAYDPASPPETETRCKPTVCIIAQQQRSPDVFEAWLREALTEFRVWRVSDEVLGDKLKLGTGYLAHLLVLREDAS